jgi:serine/threonine protein kinase
LDQLSKIFNVIGTPTDLNWPNANLLPNFIEFESREPMNLLPLFEGDVKIQSNQSVFNNDKSNIPSSSALDLILKMLTLDPLKRISAKQVKIFFYFNYNNNNNVYILYYIII